MQTVSLEKAVAMIPEGASLMIGGFMAVGTPERSPVRGDRLRSAGVQSSAENTCPISRSE